MAIYLVRHGEAKLYNDDEPKYPGPGLTKKGKQQAEKVAKQLKQVKFSKCYCSDMTRAIQTSKYFKRKFTQHRELAEFNKIVYSKDKSDKDKFNTNLKRAKNTISFFKKISKQKENILIVAHGNAIGAMLQTYQRIPINKMNMFYIENCAVIILDGRISIYNRKFDKSLLKYYLTKQTFGGK